MNRAKPDLSIVSAIVRGAEPARRPTIAERVAAVRHLAEHGYSDAQIAVLVGRSVRQVLRIRTAHGIAGLPVGTNASTRPRQNA